MAGYNCHERADGDVQVASTHPMTNEERSVLALERIADELTLLTQTFEVFLDRGGENKLPIDEGLDACDMHGGLGAGDDAEPSENLDEEPKGAPSREDGFSIGGHNYLNIQHAIEQARSVREKTVLGQRGH